MNQKPVTKILFVTLSNIGDVFLSLPSLDLLCAMFPEASVTVISGKRPCTIFDHNPRVDQVIVYDRRMGFLKKIALIRSLRDQHFDCVIDLRGSFFGWGVPARYHIPAFVRIPRTIRHMKDRHLYKVKAAVQSFPLPRVVPAGSVCIGDNDKKVVEQLLDQPGRVLGQTIVAVSAGARSHTKRWDWQGFVKLIDAMVSQLHVSVVLVGDEADALIACAIAQGVHLPILNCVGKTTLAQLVHLLSKTKLLVTNDSAVLHAASYVNKPVVALFGITDDHMYGPWSDTHVVVKKEIFCRPCQKAQCRFGTLACSAYIKVEDVFSAVKKVLYAPATDTIPAHVQRTPVKRILVARTDRIGDVLLATPVLQALRQAYPQAYIAMMVAPACRDIVAGNPFIDDVLVYDKDTAHKGWIASCRFARMLRLKHFDVAVALHPTNRVHMLLFGAGIQRRIGYDRKCGFLLTDRLKHTKQEGLQHEVAYNFDLLKFLGVSYQDLPLYMPGSDEAERFVDTLLREAGVAPHQKIIAIHPGASCPSKIWPLQRFAEVADVLHKQYGWQVILVSGSYHAAQCASVAAAMKSPVINCAGKTTILQLASLLRRAAIFISNDSGPVHVASAVGTPVVSIFGRSQPGLSPRRWGPTSPKARVLHKSVGCIDCLAHNCKKQFACLAAITVDDVVDAAAWLLKGGLS